MINDIDLQNEYRRYTIAKMKEALADAATITVDNPEPLAAALFTARISPFHYWQQKRKTELAKERRPEF